MITAERLRELLTYDRQTGVFTWRLSGKTAGSRRTDGYWRICVDKRGYLAHRLAFLHVSGEWPRQQVDHIDGDRAANRFANLRDVPRAINQQNRRRPGKNNASSKLLGAYRSGARWKAMIRIGGPVVHIGCFASKDEAHEAYLDAKREKHPGCTI